MTGLTVNYLSDVKASLQSVYDDFIKESKACWDEKQVSRELDEVLDRIEYMTETEDDEKLSEYIGDVAGSMQYVKHSIETNDKKNYNVAGRDLYVNYSRALNLIKTVSNLIIRSKRSLTPVAKMYMGFKGGSEDWHNDDATDGAFSFHAEDKKSNVVIESSISTGKQTVTLWIKGSDITKEFNLVTKKRDEEMFKQANINIRQFLIEIRDGINMVMSWVD